MNQKLSWNKLWTAVSVFLLALLIFSFGRTDVRAATAPTGLHQTDASTDSIQVDWDTVFGASTVWAKISDTESMSSSNIARFYSTYAYFSGLKAGHTYYVRVGASDTYSSDDAVWSDPIKVVTAPNKISSDIKFTKATTSSLTLKWDAPTGATSYNVLYYPASGSAETGSVAVTNTNSITIKKLKADTKYYVQIKPVRTEPGTGFAANYYISTSYLYDIPTLPKSIGGMETTSFNTNGTFEIKWNRCNASKGYEVEIYKYNGKKPLIKQSTTSAYLYISNSSKLKAAQFYKYRVRAYVANADNKKSYSDWSAFKYTSRILNKATAKKSGNKMNVSWKKFSGAKSYTIYMSTSYATNDYKKMGTTTKKNFTIKKSLKKSTYYYVRIVPVYKSGKKSYAGYGSTSAYTIRVWNDYAGKLHVYNYN